LKILLTADPELPVPPRLYGGIERIIADLARGLKTRGHQVALAAHPDSTAQVDSFYPWPGCQSNSALDTVRNARALRRAASDFRPHVVHSFSRLLYLLPLLRTRMRLLMSYQRHPNRRTTSWAWKMSRGRLKFTGCSEHICREGRPAGGDWIAIPNFVDLAKYTFQPEVSKDAPLVFLSRIELIKGTHLAIEAARRAGRQLIIAGNHAEDGDNGRYWHEQVKPHLGTDGVEYVGPVDDVQKNALLGRAAALLVPVQWDEPFGIVFAEALACGTPVVSCPRGALPEIVREGKSGFLRETVADLVVAIGKLASIDRRDCRKRAEEEFSADVVVRRYIDTYEGEMAD
jgi:glycosyltransferase involved in cell wall biosynthesis